MNGFGFRSAWESKVAGNGFLGLLWGLCKSNLIVNLTQLSLKSGKCFLLGEEIEMIPDFIMLLSSEHLTGLSKRNAFLSELKLATFLSTKVEEVKENVTMKLRGKFRFPHFQLLHESATGGARKNACTRYSDGASPSGAPGS